MAEQGRVAPGLRLCRGCRQFVLLDGRPDCAFCGGDLNALEADYEARQEEMRRAAAALSEALARRAAGKPPG